MDWLERVSPCLRPVLSGEAQISHTWHADTPSGWLEPPRVIYDHELVIFSKGAYVVEIEGVRYDCPEGSFLIVPCGKLHATWAVGERGHRYWAHFDWTYNGNYQQTPLQTFQPARPVTHMLRHAPDYVPAGVIHGHISRPERAYDLAERLCAVHSRGDRHSKVMGKALLMQLLVELLVRPEVDERSHNYQREPAVRVRELIERVDATQRIFPPIQNLLSGIGYSYAHLCREFKAAYGIPPLKYVHALRIGRAKLLLDDTDLSVSEIAYRVGFEDANYFAQVFRRMTGLSPSRFRGRR